VLHSAQSANVTDSSASQLVTAKPKKAARKSKKLISKPSVKFREDTAPKDIDVYNCSNDSFLLNPDKKVEVSWASFISFSKQKIVVFTKIKIAYLEVSRDVPINRLGKYRQFFGKLEMTDKLEIEKLSLDCLN